MKKSFISLFIILGFFSCLFLCLFFSTCSEKKPKIQIMYTVEYTIDFKDTPKTIIELVYFDADTPIGLFCIEDKTDKLNRLKLYNIGGTRSKEICATRFPILSYGIKEFKEVEIKNIK